MHVHRNKNNNMIMSKKRKEISLDTKTIELQEKSEDRKLKKDMEFILREKANDFQLSDSYKEMIDKTLDDFDKGNINFTNWDAVKCKMNKNGI